MSSSLPDVSDVGADTRFGDDSDPSLLGNGSRAGAEVYLRNLAVNGGSSNAGSADGAAVDETIDLQSSLLNRSLSRSDRSGAMRRSRSSADMGAHSSLDKVPRTEPHYQAISRLSSHTASSAGKKASRNGDETVDREEFFNDITGRPDLFAYARQDYFDLIKEKSHLAQAEGFDAPVVDSPRNAFVENLIPAPGPGQGGRPSSRAGRAAAAAREQRLAHTAALEAGAEGEDLIVSLLGQSVMDEMPELRAHQLMVAPMPLLIGRDFPRNHTVSLDHYRLGDTLGAAFGQGLSKLAEQVPIQKILLSQCTLGPVGTAAISAACADCTRLLWLDLSNNPIGNEGAAALAVMLENHCSLDTLILSKATLSDEAASTVIRSVHKNATLKKLDLTHNGIGRGNQTHLALAQLLTRNEALHTLKLGWNSIHGYRAEEFLNSLRYNTHITDLDLSWNTVGSRGAGCLGWSLRFNTALVHLDLTHNDIGERGGFVLADTLQENTTLETITLDKNPIGQRGGVALLRALKGYDALGVDRLISMQQCNFEAVEYPDELEKSLSHETLWGRTFDPMQPQGVWVCNLDDPYGRSVANGLAELAWVEDDQNWDDELTTLNGSPYDLPEPDVGIVWTREDFSLPEEGILKVHYMSTLRTPRMSDICGAVGFDAMVAMMSDRTQRDHGMVMVRLGASAFWFSAEQVGSIVSHFPDSASRVEMVSIMLPQVVDQCNMTSEILDRLTEPELRGVEVKMGEFFYFVPTNPTGHYRLELGHRLARSQAMRLVAINCEEKKSRYGNGGAPMADGERPLDFDGDHVGIDVSERGDGDIFRNETLTDST